MKAKAIAFLMALMFLATVTAFLPTQRKDSTSLDTIIRRGFLLARLTGWTEFWTERFGATLHTQMTCLL